MHQHPAPRTGMLFAQNTHFSTNKSKLWQFSMISPIRRIMRSLLKSFEIIKLAFSYNTTNHPAQNYYERSRSSVSLRVFSMPQIMERVSKEL